MGKEEGFIVKRPRARVEAQPPDSQQMKDVHAQERVRWIGPGARGKSGKRNASRRHKLDKPLAQGLVRAGVGVASQEPQVGDQRPAKQFLLGHQAKSAAEVGGEKLGDRQLALGKRAGQTRRGLHFDQPFTAIGHGDQEIRYDVAATPVFLWPRAFCRLAVEQLDLEIARDFAPAVPDHGWLLLEIAYQWAGTERHGRGGVQLALATDRAAQARAGNQQE